MRLEEEKLRGITNSLIRRNKWRFKVKKKWILSKVKKKWILRRKNKK